VPTDDPTTPQANEASATRRTGAVQYEICIQGHLQPRWGPWFDELLLTPRDDGTTQISGSVLDQSALHGLLAKLRDLGIPLISVRRCPAAEPAAPSDLPDPVIPRNPTGATQ